MSNIKAQQQMCVAMKVLAPTKRLGLELEVFCIIEFKQISIRPAIFYIHYNADIMYRS